MNEGNEVSAQLIVQSLVKGRKIKNETLRLILIKCFFLL